MKQVVFAIFIFSFVVVSSLGISKASEAPKASGASMDTSDWVTYSLGRYLIDLPADAQFYWEPLRFHGQYASVVKKDMSIEEAKEIVLKEAEEAKKAPHQTAESQFVYLDTNFDRTPSGYSIYLASEDIVLESDGIALVRYPSKSASTYLFKVYFTNIKYKDERLNKNQQVYYYEEEVVDAGHMIKTGLDAIIAARHVPMVKTDPNTPIKVIRNMRFNHGIFHSGPDSHPYHFEVGIKVRFPEHPDIVLSLFLDYVSNYSGRSFDGIETRADTVLRRTHTTIAGNSAHEILSKSKIENVSNYVFALNVLNKERNALTEGVPNIGMYLENPTDALRGSCTVPPPIQSPSFVSDEEAIEFWDKIRESVRWSPDSRVVDSPDQL